MGDYRATGLATKDVDAEIAKRIGKELNIPWVRIQLTGRVRVENSHIAVADQLLDGRQARLIFAMLVVERDRPVYHDELAEALWPHGAPRTWGAALRGVVSKVRAFLTAAGLSESATLCGGFGAYQLHLPPEVLVDVELAHCAVESAERALSEDNLTGAVTFAEYARFIAARPFLTDTKGHWVDGVRKRLREALWWAPCLLSEGYVQLGRYQLAIRTAEDAIALEPFRERTHQLLMRAHEAAGNPAEALRAYERCRRLLADELGVDPAGDTAALHLALLRQGTGNNPGDH